MADLSPVQEVIRLEAEKALSERAKTGGGCAYLSLREYAGRFDVSEAEIRRNIASLVEANQIDVSVVRGEQLIAA